MVTKEQIETLVKDADFVAAANACQTEEEAIALFGEYGIEIDSWEAFKEELISVMGTVSTEDGELDDDELAKVQGGKLGWGVCFGIGLGAGGDCGGAGIGICAIIGLMF